MGRALKQHRLMSDYEFAVLLDKRLGQSSDQTQEEEGSAELLSWSPMIEVTDQLSSLVVECLS